MKEHSIKMTPQAFDNKTGEPLYTIEALYDALIPIAEKCIQDAMKQKTILAKDTVNAITELMTGLGGEIDKVDQIKARMIETFRSIRYTTETESKNIRVSISDLFKITEMPDFKEKIATLREIADIVTIFEKSNSDGGVFERVLRVLLEKGLE